MYFSSLFFLVSDYILDHFWCVHYDTMTISCSGSLPTLEELKGFLKESRTSENNWVPLKGTSARSILKKTLSQINVKTGVASSGSDGGEDTTAYYAMSGRKIQNSMFTSESSTEVRGGTEITLDALAAYLKYLEGTGKASWQEYVAPLLFKI